MRTAPVRFRATHRAVAGLGFDPSRDPHLSIDVRKIRIVIADDHSEVVEAVRAVARGQTYVTPALSADFGRET
jgi:hypothetical protein